MKRPSKKDKAKLGFSQAWDKLLPTTLESDYVQKELKKIGDEELIELVKNYIDAFKALDKKMEEIEKEVAILLPDDSDF